jgi:hypothetical protein
MKNTAHVGPTAIASSEPFEETSCQQTLCALNVRMDTLKATVRRLRELVRTVQERRWLHENREAISYYNTGPHNASDAIEKLTP